MTEARELELQLEAGDRDVEVQLGNTGLQEGEGEEGGIEVSV